MPLEKPRSLGLALRGRNTINFVSSKHSPDGHFETEEFRNWRPFMVNTPADGYIRRRSKDQIDCMQNVEEEEVSNDANTHQWRPSKKHEARSPCPALNAAANHNYIPRHGRNLTAWCIIKGLRDCYNISWALAAMLTIGGFVIMRWNGVGRGWINPMIDLDELAEHNVLEHNASLTRLDIDEIDLSSPSFHNRASPSTPPRSRSASSSSSTAVAIGVSNSSFSWPSILSPSTYLYIPMMIMSYLFSFLYHSSSSISLTEATTTPSRRYHQASIRPDHTLIRALFADSASGTHFTLKDIARASIRRTETCPNPRISRLLRQFADAELCLTLALFSPGKELKVDIESLREWFEDERLPRSWKPRKEIGIWENHQNTSRMQEMMKALKKYKSKGEKLRTVVFE